MGQSGNSDCKELNVIHLNLCSGFLLVHGHTLELRDLKNEMES